MKHVDVFHDPAFGRLRHVQAAFPRFAEFLHGEKVADVDDVVRDEDADALPDDAYADPVARRFPIHSRKHAALSEAYARYAAPTPDVQRAIKTACEAYAIPATLFERATVVEKTAAADECLFPEARSYPVRNAGEVKLAEARLAVERVKLSAESRVAAYVRLFQKATVHGATLSPLAHKYAGLTETDAGRLRDALRARAEATTDPGYKDCYRKLAESVARHPRELSRDLRIKLATTLDLADRVSGVARHYDRGVADPMETVFNTDKVASSGVDLGAGVVPMTKLMSHDPSFYADTLGDDFLPDITTGGQLDETKLAEVLPTLPGDMKRNLSRALGR